MYNEYYMSITIKVSHKYCVYCSHPIVTMFACLSFIFKYVMEESTQPVQVRSVKTDVAFLFRLNMSVNGKVLPI